MKTERQLINFWAERDVMERLEERAQEADRSRSAEIRIAIQRYLQPPLSEEKRDG